MTRYKVVGLSISTRETKRGVVTTFSAKCKGLDEDDGTITIKKPTETGLNIGDVLEISIREKQITLEKATKGEE